jgi:DNA repair protein RadA/Sms
MGSRLGHGEIFGASSGGLRLEDPGTDLAVAAALASAETGRTLPEGAGFVGELSLAGSVRPVPGTELRLSAGVAAGLSSLVIPAGAGSPDGPSKGLQLVRVRHLREALKWALAG